VYAAAPLNAGSRSKRLRRRAFGAGALGAAAMAALWRPGQALLAVSDRQGVKLLGFDGSTQGTIAVPGSASSISWLTNA
jgi:hypothetical protein